MENALKNTCGQWLMYLLVPMKEQRMFSQKPRRHSFTQIYLPCLLLGEEDISFWLWKVRNKTHMKKEDIFLHNKWTHSNTILQVRCLALAPKGPVTTRSRSWRSHVVGDKLCIIRPCIIREKLVPTHFAFQVIKSRRAEKKVEYDSF